MAKGPRYCVPFRRRKEGKTDYEARKALLLSGKPRLVTRNSLKNMIVQVVRAKPLGDEIIVSAHSRELTTKYEWKTQRGNIPAAYLTGLLCGLKAKAKGVKEANLDIGLNAPTKGARVFAALMGFLDAGVNVPHSKQKLPDEGRMQGQDIAKYAEILTSNPEEYQVRFSEYLKQKLPPEKLPEYFAKVKREIVESLSGEKET